MQSDPRKIVWISLVVSLVCALWFLALIFAESVIDRLVGDAMPPITFIAIFIGLSALAVAALFLRWAHVREELLANRRVIARWTVSESELKAFAPAAIEIDRTDKRQALYLIWFFLALIFGAFAIFDPKAAPVMLSVGSGVAVITAIAFLTGQRISRRHLEMRTGDVIVGERGVLFNDVLHVWATPLTRLSAVTMIDRPRSLSITYAQWQRTGPQYITILLPVTPAAEKSAAAAETGLRKLIGTSKPALRQRRTTAKKENRS